MRHGPKGIVLANEVSQKGILFGWQAVDMFARAVRAMTQWKLEDVESIDTFLRLRRYRRDVDEASIVIEHMGQIFCELPFSKACDLADALQAQARKVEEEEKHEQVAFDEAVLFRSGAPFGLSDDKYIQKEAVNEALFNPQLTRNLPSINSQEVFGTPEVIRHKPGTPLIHRLDQLSDKEKEALLRQLEKEKHRG
jgi:hypothetical protein